MINNDILNYKLFWEIIFIILGHVIEIVKESFECPKLVEISNSRSKGKNKKRNNSLIISEKELRNKFTKQVLLNLKRF